MLNSASPKILEISWGRMVVEELEEGKDFILYPGGGRPWDWSETGMEHEPGIRPDEIVELIQRGCTIIILSTGMKERLCVAPETLEFCEEHGIEVHVEETETAVKIYNKLADELKPVGGLFHSTC